VAGGDEEPWGRGGDLAQGGRVGVDVGHGELDLGARFERAVAGQELVEDDAEGVDVGGRGGALAEGAFGGEVGGGADQVAGGEGGVAGG
jgi:hypothetical protein